MQQKGGADLWSHTPIKAAAILQSPDAIASPAKIHRERMGCQRRRAGKIAGGTAQQSIAGMSGGKHQKFPPRKHLWGRDMERLNHVIHRPKRRGRLPSVHGKKLGLAHHHVTIELLGGIREVLQAFAADGIADS